MNTKELVQKINEAQTPVSELFNALAVDGEALVKARKAQSHEAKRSCYLEQNSKWLSACNKVPGLDKEHFMQYLASHPKYKHVVREPEKKHSYRETALQMFAEQKARLDKFNTDIEAAAKVYVMTVVKWKQQIDADPDTATLTEQEKYETVDAIASRQLFEDVVLTNVKTLADYKEALRQFTLMHAKACELQPMLRELPMEELTKFALRSGKILAHIGQFFNH